MRRSPRSRTTRHWQAGLSTTQQETIAAQRLWQLADAYRTQIGDQQKQVLREFAANAEEVLARTGDLLLLVGELGAGKTAFVQGLGLSAPDDHTFVVKLQQPAGYFKWIATLWVSAPIRKDIVEKYGSDKWATVPSQVIGNGMFKISEQVPKDHITLVPNDNYWGPKPKLTKIIDYFIDDANQAFSKYQTGELDVQTVPLANADLVQNDAKLKNELHKLPSLNTFWLTPNLHKAPFDNVKFREAVSHAIDRQSLATNISKGQYAPVTTFIPKGMNGYQPDLQDVQKYDPAAAKAALQASGVSAAVANGVHYLARNTTTNKQLAEYITGQIKTNLGLNWTIDVIDSKTVTSRIRKAQFDIYGPDGWGADYPDPSGLVRHQRDRWLPRNQLGLPQRRELRQVGSAGRSSDQGFGPPRQVQPGRHADDQPVLGDVPLPTHGVAAGQALRPGLRGHAAR